VSERNAGADFFLTSEDEWYKAAYYDAALGVYHDYPNGSSSVGCSYSTAIRGSANCYNHVGDLTNVGAYTLSPSPNGTFDQGGNVSEWTEGLAPPLRTVRGGNLSSYPASLWSANRSDFYGDYQESNVGFRIAAVPEPRTGMLSLTALLAIAYRASRIRRVPTD
jgi:formylglycine-generating enzyme required for sulfatase activity